MTAKWLISMGSRLTAWWVAISIPLISRLTPHAQAAYCPELLVPVHTPTRRSGVKLVEGILRMVNHSKKRISGYVMKEVDGCDGEIRKNGGGETAIIGNHGRKWATAHR